MRPTAPRRPIMPLNPQRAPILLAFMLGAGVPHPAGIARYSDEALWVTSTRGNSVQLVNLADASVKQEVGVGVAPYAICCPRPDRCYISNWGGDPPREGEPQAPSSGTPTH